MKNRERISSGSLRSTLNRDVIAQTQLAGGRRRRGHCLTLSQQDDNHDEDTRNFARRLRIGFNLLLKAER